jgi:hypothetical protein
MDRQYIRDHQVIERYLHGALAPDEEKGFEEAYLADPDLLDEIELVERLKDGLKTYAPRPGRQLSGSMAPAWIRIMTSPQYAAAASVLLVLSIVFSGVLYRENLDLRSTPAFTAVATRTVPLFTLRGDSGNVVPAAEREDGLTVLAVDPGVPEYDSYRATVTRTGPDGAKVIASIDGLPVGLYQTVDIGLQDRMLTSGDYEVELEGRMDDWEPSRGYEPVSRTSFTIAARE